MHKFGGPDRRSSFGGDALEFPAVVTIFSAPNYCGSYENKGAFFVLNNGKVNMKTFNETPPPYELPYSLNVLSWSVPFLVDRTMNMLVNLLKQADHTVSDTYASSEVKKIMDDIANAQ